MKNDDYQMFSLSILIKIDYGNTEIKYENNW